MTDYSDPHWGLDVGTRRARILLHWGKSPAEVIRQLVTDGDLEPEVACFAVTGAQVLDRYAEEEKRRHEEATRPIRRPAS